MSMSSYKLILKGASTWNVKCVCNNNFFAYYYYRIVIKALRSKKIIRQLEPKQKLGSTISLCPRGVTIASGGCLGAFLWDVPTGKQLSQLRQDVEIIVYSSDGEYIAIGFGGKIQIYDNQLKQVLAQFQFVRDEKIRDLKFSFDNQCVAASFDSGYVRIWRIDGQKLYHFKVKGGYYVRLMYSPNGVNLASIDREVLKIWNIHQLESPIKQMKSDAWTICYSPDGKYIIIGVIRNPLHDRSKLQAKTISKQEVK